MAEATQDLMLELLKRVHAELGDVKREVSDVKREVQAIRTHLIGMQQDISNIYSILGNHGQRLERIDRRLNLTEPVE